MEESEVAEPGPEHRGQEEMPCGGDSEEMIAFCDSVTGKVLLDWKVWRLLGRMLNFSDLKECRRVCKILNQMVVDETNFKSRARVTLTPATMKPEVFGTTEILFKNFDLKLDPEDLAKAYLSNSSGKKTRTEKKKEKKKQKVEDAAAISDPFSWFYPKLEEAEFLCLRLMRTKGVKQVLKKQGHILEASKQLILAAKKLKHLGLELEFIFFAIHDYKPSSADDVSHWASTGIQLDSFEVLDCKEWLTVYSHDHRSHAINLERVKLLTSGVRRLKLPKILPVGYIGTDPQGKQLTLRTILLELADAVQPFNRCTIQHIAAHRKEACWWSNLLNKLVVDFIFNDWIVFPELRGMDTREAKSSLPGLCRLLSRQPDLENISFSVEYGPLTPNLIQTIAQKSSKLRKLYLRASRFDAVLENPKYWIFLYETKLREFHLEIEEFPDADMVVRHAGGMGFPREALKNLPATVEKIFIRGFHGWTLDTKIGAEDFAGIRPKKLTELTLSNCGGCIDDGTVEYICKNLKMLRTLDLTGAIHCTDAGFTGTSTLDGAPACFCLSDLKGMKELILRGCTGITNVTLNGIEFLELTHLDIVDLDKVTPGVIETVLDQNPSLETLLTSDATILGQKAELIAKHPRLKSIASD